jgi:hypothetical protein
VRQHLGREIEGDHLVPSFGEVSRVATGAAGDIGDAPEGQGVEQRPDRRDLGLEERIVLAVVARRPDGVAVADGDVADVDQGHLAVDGVDDAAHFVQPCLEEAIPDVVAGPVAEQGQAFEPEQPGRVLPVETHRADCRPRPL